MRRLLAVLALLAVLSPEVRPQDWRIEVNHAIERGVVALLRYQEEDGSFRTPIWKHHSEQYPMGSTALGVYTLLKSGVPAEDPAVKRSIEKLRYMDFKKVYSVSVLVFALDAARTKEHDAWIGKAARWLEGHLDAKTMQWAYPENHVDLSNTQFAVLALRLAEKHGYAVARNLWRDLAEKTIESMGEDRGYGYRPDRADERSTASMTAAGITVLHVAAEGMKDQKGYAHVRRRALAAIDKAWSWLDLRFCSTGNTAGEKGLISHVHSSSPWHYYFLYGLERIATFSERKEVGGRDWYAEGAAHLLSTEKSIGGWYSFSETCFALLFLRRATFTSSNPAENPVPRSMYWRFEESSEEDEKLVTADLSWTKPGFDDRTWLRGAGPMGSRDSTSEPFRTGWNTRWIKLRRGFQWKKKPEDLSLWVLCDDKARVWINGVEAGAFESYGTVYRELKISEAARETLKAGENLIAVLGENPAGAGAIDLRIVATERQKGLVEAWNGREKRFAWWRGSPETGAPSLRRWLALGPVPDSKCKRFLGEPLNELELAPRAGQKGLGATWKEYVSPSALIDLGDFSKARNGSLYCAFTWLEVKEKGRYLLWFDADDSVAVYVDGRIRFRHHRQSTARFDRFRVPLDLEAGDHRLLIKVWNQGGAATFNARVTDDRGRATEKVLPKLDAENPDLSALARTQPELFGEARLLEMLPTGRIPRLTFSSAKDLDELAIGPSRAGYPRWFGKIPRKAAYRPAPGGSGFLMTWPASGSHPTRVYRKFKLSRDRHEFSVKVSPEAHLRPGEGGVRVRLGVFDDEGMRWLAAEELVTPEKPSPKAWAKVTTPVEGKADREVLLVIELGVLQSGLNPCAWIDEITIR